MRTPTKGQPPERLTRDDVLDNITLYWLTSTGVSSARSYWDNKPPYFGPKKFSIPAAFTVFPGEIYQPSRRWAERGYANLSYFHEVDKGGHFAAWEEPLLFASEMRAAFRSLRGVNAATSKSLTGGRAWRAGMCGRLCAWRARMETGSDRTEVVNRTRHNPRIGRTTAIADESRHEQSNRPLSRHRCTAKSHHDSSGSWRQVRNRDRGRIRCDPPVQGADGAGSGAHGAAPAHQATRFPDRETVTDASQGVQLATIQELARYWATEYDWRKCEARLQALPQFITEIDGLDIHFIHVRSKHKSALPLIVTHGWPGSIVEQLKIIEPLTNPTAHGGSASDAFDVVIPSMPGYGVLGQADHDRLGSRPHRARLGRADEAPRLRRATWRRAATGARSSST